MDGRINIILQFVDPQVQQKFNEVSSRRFSVFNFFIFQVVTTAIVSYNSLKYCFSHGLFLPLRIVILLYLLLVILNGWVIVTWHYYLQRSNLNSVWTLNLPFLRVLEMVYTLAGPNLVNLILFVRVIYGNEYCVPGIEYCNIYQRLHSIHPTYAIMSFGAPLAYSIFTKCSEKRITLFNCFSSFILMELAVSLTHLTHSVQVPVLAALFSLVIYEVEKRDLENFLTVSQLSEIEKQSSLMTNALMMRRTYSRYISHEIRTPLSVAKLGLDLIEDDSKHLSGETRPLIINCKEAISGAVKILNELIENDQIESSFYTLTREMEPFLDVFTTNIKPFAIMAREKKVDMSLDVEIDPSFLSPIPTIPNKDSSSLLLSRHEPLLPHPNPFDSLLLPPPLILSTTHNNNNNITIDDSQSFVEPEVYLEDLHPSCVPFIDKQKISQVIRHLISNSLKYTQEKQKISIKISFLTRSDPRAQHYLMINSHHLFQENSSFRSNSTTISNSNSSSKSSSFMNQFLSFICYFFKSKRLSSSSSSSSSSSFPSSRLSHSDQEHSNHSQDHHHHQISPIGSRDSSISSRKLSTSIRHSDRIYHSIQSFLLGNDPQIFPMSSEEILKNNSLTQSAQSDPRSHPVGLLLVEVSDNGAGISPLGLKNLFTGGLERLEAGGGSGLGLANSKRFIELHQGCMHAHSEGEGKGSSFVFCLDLYALPPRLSLSPSGSLSSTDECKPLSHSNSVSVPHCQTKHILGFEVLSLQPHRSRLFHFSLHPILRRKKYPASQYPQQQQQQQSTQSLFSHPQLSFPASQSSSVNSNPHLDSPSSLKDTTHQQPPHLSFALQTRRTLESLVGLGGAPRNNSNHDSPRSIVSSTSVLSDRVPPTQPKTLLTSDTVPSSSLMMNTNMNALKLLEPIPIPSQFKGVMFPSPSITISSDNRLINTRILIVEDVEMVRKLTKRTLESKGTGNVVHEASDGLRAIEMIQERIEKYLLSSSSSHALSQSFLIPTILPHPFMHVPTQQESVPENQRGVLLTSDSSHSISTFTSNNTQFLTPSPSINPDVYIFQPQHQQQPTANPHAPLVTLSSEFDFSTGRSIIFSPPSPSSAPPSTSSILSSASYYDKFSFETSSSSSSHLLDSIPLPSSSSSSSSSLPPINNKFDFVSHPSNDHESSANIPQEEKGLDDWVEYGVILMDSVMPVMEGPEAVSRLREMGYRGLILGLTGNVLPEDVEHFKSRGADGVLSKPLNYEKMIEMIQDRLNPVAYFN